MKTIIEMAHDAGFDITYDPTETPTRCFVEAWEDQLEAFAALVAAAEQKKWEQQTAIEINEAILDEREACAKLADEYATWGGSNFFAWFKRLSADIRARGNT
jgi:hypothetical protein